jgi:isoleucyl-tRNA synthetase
MNLTIPVQNFLFSSYLTVWTTSAWGVPSCRSLIFSPIFKILFVQVGNLVVPESKVTLDSQNISSFYKNFVIVFSVTMKLTFL